MINCRSFRTVNGENSSDHLFRKKQSVGGLSWMLDLLKFSCTSVLSTGSKFDGSTVGWSQLYHVGPMDIWVHKVFISNYDHI